MTDSQRVTWMAFSILAMFFSFEVSECDVIGGQWWRLQCQSFSHASSTKDTFEQYEELRTSISSVQIILNEA